MIGYLKGTVKNKDEAHLLVEVKGVGFLLSVPHYLWQKASYIKRSWHRPDEGNTWGWVRNGPSRYCSYSLPRMPP